MTIKELMSQVDINRVIDAFLLMDYSFSQDAYESTFFEKYEAVPKLRRIIEDNVRLFAECSPADDTKPCTIFILYTQDDDFDNKWKKSFASFAIDDEEVVPVLDKDFHILDDDGEAQITQYAYDHISINEMAGYFIADVSIKRFGKEICAAKILSDIFFWGLYPEDREKKAADLDERLQQDEKELCDSREDAEIMKRYRNELVSNMSDDEKAYHFAKEKFEEETKDIVQRYWVQVIEDTQLEYIHAIKEEYSRRKKTF